MPGDYHQVLKNITVNGTAVVYSDAIDTRQARFLGLRIKSTSVAGTPDIKVEWEVGQFRPSTENAADTEYVVPNNMSAILSSLADELWHVLSISPPPASFGRLKVTGNAANPADSVVTAQIFMQG